MGLFKPPIGITSTIDASTLNGKLESQLSVDNSAKLGGVSAKTYSDGLITFPEPTVNKQVLYRSTLENRIPNPLFNDGLDNWTYDTLGDLEEASVTIDNENYYISPQACNISFDTTGLEINDTTGVSLIMHNVDLTGVDQITFYAKQLSASNYYTDIQVTNFYIGSEYVSMHVDGIYGGSSGHIDNKWRKCYTELGYLPEELKIPDQTLTFNFTTWWDDKEIEFVVDNFIAYGPPSTSASWIPNIDTYIHNQIDHRLELPNASKSRKFLYRNVLNNKIPGGNMERDVTDPWYVYEWFGETLSIDSDIFHSGTRSLKVELDMPQYNAYVYVCVDDVDLTNVDYITYWIYGGTNCTNGEVKLSLGEYNEYIPFDSNKWTQLIYKVPINSKGPGQNLTFEMRSDYANNVEIYLDDVEAYSASDKLYTWGTSTIYHGELEEDPSDNVFSGDEYFNTIDSNFYKYNGNEWIGI